MRENAGQIAARLRSAPEGELLPLLELYGNDERSTVQKALVQARKRLDALEAERERISLLWSYEHELKGEGPVCGIDEVGRGPLAGPVYAAAVILPMDCDLLYVNDSKQLTALMREKLAKEIREVAVSYGIGQASPERIDEINILNATYEAMREAISHLSVKPGVLLVDAVHIPGVQLPQRGIIKGDSKSISIAAASIVAKVARDALMAEYDSLYPEYGFASNKGYGSASHIEAIRKYGPCPIHRRSFIGHFLQEET